MAIETLSPNSKLVVYNSDTDLEAKGVIGNHQGATLSEVVAAAGVSTGGGSAELTLTRPVADPSKAGEKVYYNGEEWIYATTAWLEALGIDTLVSEGYPLPYDITQRSERAANFTKAGLKYFPYNFLSAYDIGVRATAANIDQGLVPAITWDFLHLGLGASVPQTYISFEKYLNPNTSAGEIPCSISKIVGAELLTELEDAGTISAFNITISGAGGGPTSVTCDAAVIDDFFTQLPPTTKTATLVVDKFTGAAACDPQIATAKGYSVIR